MGRHLTYAHSMQTLSKRALWWMTAASLAWVWGLLSVAWPTRYALCLGLAVYLGAATWVTGRRPWAGVGLTALGMVALGLLGIGVDTPVPVGPLFVGLVIVGYLVSPPWSVLAVPLLLVSTALPARWDTASVVFGACLITLPWWFGVRVRVRDERRRRAVEDARRLAGVDPTALGVLAAAAEREEVAASAFEVIGHAVEQMNEHAAQARETLDPGAIEAIHRKGDEATQRLRALLELLRHEPPPGLDPRSEGSGDDEVPDGILARRRGTGVGGLLAAGWPGLLILADVFGMQMALGWLREEHEVTLPGWQFVCLVALPLVVLVGLRRWRTEVALWGAAVVIAVGAATGIARHDGEGLWLMIVAIVLSWAAGEDGTRRVLLAWFVFTMALGAAVFYDAPQYLPIYLALEVLPYGAAAVWAGHHEVETASRDLAQSRQGEIEAAERAAVSRERLGLARDLHDAASHAVGTMMMQANAARVLRLRDPAGAQAALDAVVAIGREAAAELQEIRSRTGVTESGGPEGLGGDAARGIADAVAPLVTAARRSGAEVTTSLDLTAAPGPEDVVLLLRVVREGLANAVRHAPGSEVRVHVSAGIDQVRVQVVNGPARPAPGQDGGVMAPMGLGLGLRGLRELLSERHGQLSADRSGGGFRLCATFPPQSADRPAVLP